MASELALLGDLLQERVAGDLPRARPPKGDLAVAGRGHRHRRRGAEEGGGEVHACAGRDGRAHEATTTSGVVVTASRVDSRDSTDRKSTRQLQSPS